MQDNIGFNTYSIFILILHILYVRLFIYFISFVYPCRCLPVCETEERLINLVRGRLIWDEARVSLERVYVWIDDPRNKEDSLLVYESAFEPL